MIKELHSRPDLLGGAHIPKNLFIYCSFYDHSNFPPKMTEYHKIIPYYVVNENINSVESPIKWIRPQVNCHPRSKMYSIHWVP